MASRFTDSEWKKINNELNRNPDKYGFPKQNDTSVLLGSFNIRKLGKVSNRNKNEWKFLVKTCKQFDLLAIQEILDDLAGIRKLLKDMNHGNDQFGLVISDATGTFPGEPGNPERLGYIFRWSKVQRCEIVSDVTYDRTKVVRNLYENLGTISESFSDFDTKMRSFEAGLRSSKPSIKMPVFLSFIRQPYIVGFRIGANAQKPYEIMAINAHLLYGHFMSDREQEFEALMEWIIERTKQETKTYFDNFILLGDLNLNFDNPERDRASVSMNMKTFNSDAGNEFDVNFPFIDPHLGENEVYRTNARKNQTFDQIGLFFKDDRFTDFERNGTMNDNNTGPNYGMFDFVSLFAIATVGKEFSQMTSSEKKSFYPKFEHKVSDHMPIWLRLPMP